MTGRSLHDALLAVLTDGDLRHRLFDGDTAASDRLGGDEARILGRVDRQRLRGLARFMARHFYRERIVRLFRYGRALAQAQGHDPLAVLQSAEFGALLDRAVLGSPATAAAVARLVEARLLADLANRPFGTALVGYEGTMFRVEAGPRRWHGAGSSNGIPVRSPHCRILHLDWNLTPLITALRAGHPSPPEPVPEPTRLLIALSPRGRVTAVRCGDAVAQLLDALDGQRDQAEAARLAGVAEADAHGVLGKLAEIGAVDWLPSRASGAGPVDAPGTTC